MEAREGPDESASWRPRKAFQPEAEGLTTRNTSVCRPEMMDASAQAGRQPAPQHFGSAGPLADWMVPTCIGVAIFFPQSTALNAHLFWKQPHRHTRK